MKFGKTTELFPWSGRPSILEWIRSHPGDPLPDESDVQDEESGLRWAPGALDGVLGHHMENVGDQVLTAMSIAKKWEMQLNQPNDRTRRETYIEIVRCDLLSIIDELIKALSRLEYVDGERFYEEALWCATKGAHRNVVKFGLAMIGMFGIEEQRDLMMEFGAHEEFTLFAVVSIRNSQKDANDLLFELAKKVHGWGKIQVVERFEPQNVEMKQWLLSYGCKNQIMNEYLAYTCAVKGDLVGTLRAESISTELYSGIGLILEALINGGPSKGIDDYEFAAEAVARYLTHASVLAQTLADFDIVRVIFQFLQGEDESEWIRRFNGSCGWSHEIRQSGIQLSNIIMRQGKWVEMIQQPLDPSNRVLTYCQMKAGKALGIDMWPAGWAAIQNQPQNDGLYVQMTAFADEARLRHLISFAEQKLPLKKIATGAGVELGFGEAYQPHHTLNVLLRELTKMPGIGMKLLVAGAHSPVVSNRAMVQSVLESWPRDVWFEPLKPLLMSALDAEPDADLRRQWESLLSVATIE